MIRLEIDNQPVNISQDVMFDFYDYNAIFDSYRNRGAFTYDIDIDLRDSNNARLYSHLNRINATTSFAGRHARLVVDGKIIIEGKEIILESNGPIVKIQIVGGNSEVNYSGGNIRIRELDLGVLPEYTEELALASINAEVLSVDAVCTPVMVEYRKIPFVTQEVERETVSKMKNLAEYTDLWSNNGSYHTDTPFIGQPYLVIVIEKILQAIGWKVAFNILRELEYSKRLIIIHGYNTREINKMIPNWTVNEFLEQVQRMFNVIIIYKDETHTVEIHKRDVFYQQIAQTVEVDIDDVIYDETSPGRNFNGSDEYVYGYESVKYDLPSQTYGYRGDISDDVNSLVTVMDFNSASEFNAPGSSYRSEDFFNTPVFMRDLSNNTKWMLAKGTQGGIPYHIVRVDQFAHARQAYYVEGESTETVLKIVPAETLVMSIYMNSPALTCGVVVPYASQAGEIDADLTTSKDYGLNQWVEGNSPKARDTSSDKLFVAQFLGRTSVLQDSHEGSSETINRLNTARYPQVFTHRYIDGRLYDIYSNTWNGRWRDYIMDALWDKPDLENDITFNLQTRLVTTYSNPLRVNDKEVHTIVFRATTRYNVWSIFNIAGRRFVCVSLLYKLQDGRLSSDVIGTFLPLK